MLWIFILIALSLIGCSSPDRDVVIQPIPGTEQVAIFDFCISVSPDEKWLTFPEYKLPKSRVSEELPPDEYEARVVSLDLDTGARTAHAINSIPPRALGFSPDEAGWQRQAGYEIIEQRFHPGGWRGERFYFRPYSATRYLALEPTKPGIQIAAKPQTPGTCSDCPAVSTTRFRDHSWDLLSKTVSAVVDGGNIQSVYYVTGPSHGRWDHLRSIYRMGKEGPEELVVENPEKKGNRVMVVDVRVSPDEHFLAYVVRSKKQAFLSGPSEEIKVVNLDSGDIKKIARHSSAGNLVWSRDGDRLYYAAGEYDDDRAIYILDVAATFGPP